jgi:predicted unusual protein kinase regulating ubiquinone biosynthesis (AarF/ABC1/UbiB family)
VVKRRGVVAGAGLVAVTVATAALVAVARRRDLLHSRAGRNLAVARLGGRLGRRQAVHLARRTFASAERREALDREHELATAADVAGALGDMKGVLMKLGQLASFLDDGLPEPVREALASLQQDAPPMRAELAAEVIERELGAPPDVVFAEWDPVPIAAASIGQVHRAVTRDGQAVAVKVQYPGVDKAIRTDLDNTQFLLQTIGMLFPGLDAGPMVEEIKARFGEEIDYRLEAKNQRQFADFYRGHPFIHVPDVVDGLSTGRVLTTELVVGARFSDVVATWSQEERDRAGETIYRFVFRSIYRMHAFNGDPHPGNYLFHPGGRVTFLDFGLVKHFVPEDIALFVAMIDAIVLDRDPRAFRRVIEEGKFLHPGAPLTDDEVVDYFGHFYQLLTDEVRAVTHEYASEMVTRLFDFTQRFGAMTRHANLPPEFVIVQRINLGLYAVLAELGSRANWYRVARELWPQTSDTASTELGRQEATWLATRTS